MLKRGNPYLAGLLVIMGTFMILIFYPSAGWNELDYDFYYTSSKVFKVGNDMVVQTHREMSAVFNEVTGEWEYVDTEWETPDWDKQTDPLENIPPPSNAYFPVLDPRLRKFVLTYNPHPSRVSGIAPNPLGSSYLNSYGHDGTDIVGKDANGLSFPNDGTSETINAVKAGLVVFVRNTGSNYKGPAEGAVVWIAHADATFTGYFHMWAGSIPSDVKVGAFVSAGQLLGRMSNSGNATAKHLHFETVRNTNLTSVKLESAKASTLYYSVWGSGRRPQFSTYIKALDRPGTDPTQYLVPVSEIPDAEVPPSVRAEWAK